MVKLRFTGVYISFLILSKKHRLWVLGKTFYEYLTNNLCFRAEERKLAAS